MKFVIKPKLPETEGLYTISFLLGSQVEERVIEISECVTPEQINWPTNTEIPPTEVEKIALKCIEEGLVFHGFVVNTTFGITPLSLIELSKFCDPNSLIIIIDQHQEREIATIIDNKLSTLEQQPATIIFES